jgi:hypothetical protein
VRKNGKEQSMIANHHAIMPSLPIINRGAGRLA